MDSAPSTQSALQQMNLNEFSIINQNTGVVQRDLADTDEPPLFLQHKTNSRYFKLICMNQNQVDVQNVEQTTHIPQFVEPVSEPSYFEWLNPVSGSPGGWQWGSPVGGNG